MNSSARKLLVAYDSSLPLIAVSPSVWTATGPLQWFDNYHIISSIDNPLGLKLHTLDIRQYDVDATEEFKSVKQIYASESIKRLESDKGIGNYNYVMNRASSGSLGGRHKLGNDHALVSEYEDKVWFRENYASSVPFADFQILPFQQLLEQDAYSTLASQLAEDLVIQHPKRAGSTGTHFASNLLQFQMAIEALKETIVDFADKVVVSRRVLQVRERSLQACITKDGVLVGPAQAQLVRHPLLTVSIPSSIQFCGGRIDANLVTQQQYSEMEAHVQTVGKDMQKRGYRGIFGMDFLLSDDMVYVLEVNPRMTGMTSLLAFVQQEVPFLLLHILELATAEYHYDSSVQVTNQSGSFLQVYAQQACRVTFETGLYDKNLVKVGEGFEDMSILPESEEHFFIGLRVNPGQEAVIGKSLAFIYSRTQLFDDEGTLSVDAEHIVKTMRDKYIIPSQRSSAD